MLDNMKIKGRLVKKDEQNIYLATWDGKTLKIPKEGINELKVKKFSYLKTGSLYTSNGSVCVLSSLNELNTL